MQSKSLPPCSLTTRLTKPGRVPLHRDANERTVAQRKSPRKILRPADPDARIGHDFNGVVRPRSKTMRALRAKIDLMMPPIDREGLRQLARTGTKSPDVFHAAPRAHERKTAPRLNRPNENEPIPWPAFDEDIQHPVHAVVEIDVGRSGLVPLHERTRARALEGVTGFVVFDQVRFGLHDKAGAFFPDELRADQVFSTKQRIGLKKNKGQHAGKLAERRAAKSPNETRGFHHRR
jgi:hypothetical protein